ncbi:UNVERIFIED_CONTAM: hypothetical protein HDU68_010442 [Siphonaria sp. JEL0065]|nr:hypothetical protein HDU68_010442 [Siphonaria sp. JEL0065]
MPGMIKGLIPIAAGVYVATKLHSIITSAPLMSTRQQQQHQSNTHWATTSPSRYPLDVQFVTMSETNKNKGGATVNNNKDLVDGSIKDNESLKVPLESTAVAAANGMQIDSFDVSGLYAFSLTPLSM